MEFKFLKLAREKMNTCLSPSYRNRQERALYDIVCAKEDAPVIIQLKSCQWFIEKHDEQFDGCCGWQIKHSFGIVPTVTAAAICLNCCDTNVQVEANGQSSSLRLHLSPTIDAMKFISELFSKSACYPMHYELSVSTTTTKTTEEDYTTLSVDFLHMMKDAWDGKLLYETPEQKASLDSIPQNTLWLLAGCYLHAIEQQPSRSLLSSLFSLCATRRLTAACERDLLLYIMGKESRLV